MSTQDQAVKLICQAVFPWCDFTQPFNLSYEVRKGKLYSLRIEQGEKLGTTLIKEGKFLIAKELHELYETTHSQTHPGVSP